jgi:hypothetical protein
MRDDSLFSDQASMLRRLVDQIHDPDRNDSSDRLARLEREELELQNADDNEEQDYCDRWDGLA